MLALLDKGIAAIRDFGAEALVGQAAGAGNRAALRRAAVVSSLWGAAVVLGFALVFAVAGGWIIDLMATDTGVRAAARDYLPWMVAAPLVGWASWMLDGIFIGATRTADMRNMMLVSGIIYALCAVPLVAAFGNHGLWAAYLVSYAARGVTLALRYPALERAVSPR